jgi:hypothetical protein
MSNTSLIKEKSNEGYLPKEYAIVMLCMLKNHYVLGACIAAFTHKFILTQNNIENIDLVIMCDNVIYTRYKSLLSRYFDRVEKINLDKFSLSKKYRFTERWIAKYGWINYSTNKWQCLKLVDYKKILFIDIDILPVSDKFYKIFSQNTPSFSNHYIVNDRLKIDENIKNENIKNENIKNENDKDVKNNDKIYDPLNKINSYDEYTKMKSIQTLNGGLVLLKPDIKVYDKYKDFIGKIFNHGLFSPMVSGPDESSLFYFYTKIHPEKMFYKISKKYQVTPWDDPEKYLCTALSYNFVSYVKPWLKPKFLTWPEENIWRDIYEKIPFNKALSDLLKESILTGFDMYLGDDTGFMNKYVKSHPEIIDYILAHDIIDTNDTNNTDNTNDTNDRTDGRFERIIKKEKSLRTTSITIKQKSYGMIQLKSLKKLLNKQRCVREF